LEEFVPSLRSGVPTTPGLNRRVRSELLTAGQILTRVVESHLTAGGKPAWLVGCVDLPVGRLRVGPGEEITEL